MSRTFAEAMENRRKQRGEVSDTSSAQGTGSSVTAVSRPASTSFAQAMARRQLNLDTFSSDYESTSHMLNNTLSNWQDASTLSQNRVQVENMASRLKQYRDYVKAYEDPSELSSIDASISSYDKALAGWDDMAQIYGHYQNADAYSTARKKSELSQRYGDMTYEEVKKELSATKFGSDENNYLSEYGVNHGFSSLADYDAALADARSGKYKDDLQAARNQYVLDHASEKYAGLKENADYKELSAYSPNVNANKKYTVNDPTYEAVNARQYGDVAASLLSESRGTGVFGKGAHENLDRMTDDEVGYYNYIYATQGKKAAEDYLDDIQVMLDKRNYDEDSAMLEDTIDNSVLASAGFSALSVPANIVGAVASANRSLSDAITGKEYNPYSKDQMLSNFASDTRQDVSENIAEATPNMNLLGTNVPAYLYQIGLDMADSAVGAATMGSNYSIVAGLSAFQQEAKDLKEAGATEQQIWMGAGLAGIFEKIFEDISLDKLIHIDNVADAPKLIKAALKQAGIEGSEEISTEIANIISNDLVMGNRSDIMQKYYAYREQGYSEDEIHKLIGRDLSLQIAQAGIGGALSGGLMGGGKAAMDLHTNNSLGNTIQQNETVGDLAGLAESMGVNTDAYSETLDAYNRYFAGKDTSKVKPGELGDLYRTAEMESYNDYVAGEQSGDTDRIERASRNLNTLATVRQGLGAEEKAARARAKAMTQEGMENVQIDSVTTDDTGKRILHTDQGDVVLNKASLNENQAYVVSQAEDMDDAKASVMIRTYDGNSNPQSYVESFKLAYAYGESGYGADYALSHKGTLTAAQARDAYVAGVKNRATDPQRRISEIVSQYQGENGTGMADYSEVELKKLTMSQKDDVAAISAFAVKEGINVKFYADASASAANGHYDAKENMIYINVHAGTVSNGQVDQFNGAINTTFSHELTHWMKDKSPGLYDQMREIVMNSLENSGDYLGEKGVRNVREAVAVEENRMENAHKDAAVTEESAIDEMVARACEDMFSNSEYAEKVLRSLDAPSQKTLVGKIKEMIDSFREVVKRIMGKFSAKSAEAKALREMDGRLTELRKAWDAALADAVKANAAVRNHSETKQEQFSDRDNEGNSLSEDQKSFFRESKIRDENGNLKVMYHGTARMDRVGTIFRPDRATSGPMAYFTDNNEIANSYANNKKDTSMSYDDMYDSYYTQFRVERNGESIAIGDYWGKLSVSQRNEIAKKAPHITMDDDYENIIYDPNAKNGLGGYDSYLLREHKGNVLEALVDAWLESGDIYGDEEKFIDVLKLVGINNAVYMNPDYTDRGVYSVYLNVTSPFDTSNISDGMLDKLKNAAEIAEKTFQTTDTKNADMWDKNNINPMKWVERLQTDIKDGTTYVWTSIPDFVTDVLKANGYDGIVDSGGKYSDDIHTVVIPFYSNQIKNIDNVHPTDNADIRYSMRINEDGMEEYTTDDPEILSMSYAERRKHALNIILNENKGRTAKFEREGDVYYAITTESGVGKFLRGDSKSSKNGVKAKANVAANGNYIDLMENAHYVGTATEHGEQKNSFHNDAKYWDYYWKTVIVDGTKYDVLINVKDTGKDYYTYDVTLKEAGSLADTTSISAKEGLMTPAPTSLKHIISHKLGDINVFSDRQEVYQYVNQTERLQKENKQLRDDIDRLRERLKLERKVTGGRVLNDYKLELIAKHLKNQFNSNYDTDSFKAGLKDLYNYILNEDEIDGQVVLDKSVDLARSVLSQAKPQKVANDYFKMIARDIRGTKISLSESQKAEAENAFGKDWRKYLFGRITVTNDGTSLDTMWQEWSSRFPGLFDSSVNEAEQITALNEIYNTSRESSEVITSYNETEAVRALATEIYHQYWNADSVKTVADKYSKQITQLNAKHNQAMRELRQSYKNRLEQRTNTTREYYQSLLKSVREQRDYRIKEAKVAADWRQAEYKDRIAKKDIISKITKNALTLNKWLVQNSAKEHVPDVLKAPVVQLLNAIDFSSKQYLSEGEKSGVMTQKDVKLFDALEKVRDMALKIQKDPMALENEMGGYYVDLPVDFYDTVAELTEQAKAIGESAASEIYVLNNMTAEQLKTLNKVVKTLKTTVSKMNKTLAGRQTEYIGKLGVETIAEMNKFKQHQTVRGIEKVHNFLSFDNTLPYYYFKRLGPSGKTIFTELSDGFGRLAFRLKSIEEFTKTIYEPSDVKRAKETVKSFTAANGKEVRMTVAQMMSLHCLAKRQQAVGHLFEGGARVEDFSDPKSVGKLKTISMRGGFNLDQEFIDKVNAALSPKEIEIADKLQEYMSTTLSGWGNEVTQARWGINGFEEKSYFPIESDAEGRGSNQEKMNEASMYRLLNQGFTKGLTPGANNRIMIRDIFDVFSTHSAEMAKYSTVALPVLDTIRWFNYVEKGEKTDVGFETSSVKGAIKDVFGEGGSKYLNQLIEDINGTKHNDRSAPIMKKLIKNAKVAAVAGNLRVVLLQPTAYYRAMGVMNPTYLMRASFTNPFKGINEAEDNCGIAQWKARGLFDTNVSRSVEESITNNLSRIDKFVDFSMAGAEWADKITWGYLWNACKLEVAETTPRNSSDYLQKVSDRFSEVVYSTQVVDSTLTRSQMMRSSSTYDQMLTSFMSEPTLSYNMLLDCYYDWKLEGRRNGTAGPELMRRTIRTFATYTATATASAICEAAMDALRDWDEDEEFTSKMWEEFVSNFISDLNPLNKLPVLKDIVGVLEGYDPSRMDEQALTNLVENGKQWVKIAQGDGNLYRTTYKTIQGLSQLTGIPISNYMRDIVAIWNDTIARAYPSIRIE